MDQQKHPEIREGEVFVTNCMPSVFPQIGWKTKRRGIVAYDRDGTPVKEMFPVFIQQSEPSPEELAIILKLHE